MIRNISIGIELGSQVTRVVVGEFLKGEKNPKIIGVGETKTKGVRHGYIVNAPLALASLRTAIVAAENSSQIKIKQAFVALGGTSLRSEITSGIAIISKADGEVTNLDVSKALDECESNLNLGNKKIIKSFPIAYRLDGKEVQGRLEGMRGTKLEVKALFVTYSMQHFEDLIEVLAEAGVEVLDVVPGILAGAELILTEKQKIVGCALVNIGGDTVSLGIFENGFLVSLYTFKIGSEDITNDIALGLKIPLDQADSLKLGSVSFEYSRKKLDEIVEARLTDIFELIENHLKKIKRSELLPAGVIFIGGGANIGGLQNLSKEELKLPSTIGTSDVFGNAKTKLRDPSWFTVLGVLTAEKDSDYAPTGSFSGIFKNLKNTIKSGIKQLMP